MELTGAKIVMECLLEQGVDTVFGYPGATVIGIYDELHRYRRKIRHILTSHEQGAAHAADGYARATGRTAVCLATSGPGATNLLTGIAAAYMDSSPVVFITGNVSCGQIGRDSFQEVDISSIAMPVTKHSCIVKDAARLADTLREAFAIASGGRPGPVLVDIPKDLIMAKARYEPMPGLGLRHRQASLARAGGASGGQASLARADGAQWLGRADGALWSGRALGQGGCACTGGAGGGQAGLAPAGGAQPDGADGGQAGLARADGAGEHGAGGEACSAERAQDGFGYISGDADILLGMISRSARPMIISGGGVIRANASEELRAFARAIRAPVACTMMGLGSIGGDDPLFLGLVGMYGSNAANAACGMCDLLIAVGMRFSDRVAPCPELFARGAKIVHIDIDRAEIDKNVITAHHITGDAKIVLRRLLQKLPGGAGLGGMARDGAAAGAWLGMAKPPPGGAAAGSASAAGAAAAAGCNVGAMAGATACAATGAANVANAAVGETSAAGATAGAAAGTTGALAGKAASVAGAAAAAGSNFGAMAGAAAGAAAGATSAAGIAGATAKGASAAANCAGGAQPGGAALSPRGIIASVQRHAGDGAVIVTDVGQHQLWAAQYYSFASPRTFITSGGYGAMGFGLGAAIGAHIGIHGGAKPPPRKSAALPRVVLITGDGSFRMNLTELSTLRCYGLPIIIVIVNNKSLGMVRQWQRLSFGGRFSYTDLEREPDFVKLAGAYGIPGYKAASPAELDGALGAAVASGRAAIVECALPKDELVAPTGAPDAAPADAPTGVPDDGAR